MGVISQVPITHKHTHYTQTFACTKSVYNIKVCTLSVPQVLYTPFGTKVAQHTYTQSIELADKVYHPFGSAFVSFPSLWVCCKVYTTHCLNLIFYYMYMCILDTYIVWWKTFFRATLRLELSKKKKKKPKPHASTMYQARELVVNFFFFFSSREKYSRDSCCMGILNSYTVLYVKFC